MNYSAAATLLRKIGGFLSILIVVHWILIATIGHPLAVNLGGRTQIGSNGFAFRALHESSGRSSIAWDVRRPYAPSTNAPWEFPNESLPVWNCHVRGYPGHYLRWALRGCGVAGRLISSHSELHCYATLITKEIKI